MSYPALQMSTNDPSFWVLVIIAISFVVIAVAMVSIAVFARRAVASVGRLEERAEPVFARVTALGEQVQQIAAQGREVAAQVAEMSMHLSTATKHFSETAAIIKDEVRELKEIVGLSAEVARNKVELISRSIDETHQQVTATTTFVQTKMIEPAREIAAIMAGIRRGLEVLVAPQPKQINQTYGEEEMFIG